MTKWQEQPLGKVCSFLNRGVSPKYVDEGGICVLNQKCVRDHAINYEPSRRHDSAAKSVSQERLVRVGDVLVNSTGTGTLGRVAQLRQQPPEPTTVDSHVTIVRPKAGLFYEDFFGYMMVVIEDAIKEAGEGCGGQTELARSTLAEKFRVRFPEDQTEQRRIVALLDDAFDGISTATANAEKNLQNARAVFESQLAAVFASPGTDWKEMRLDEVSLDFGRGKSKHRPRNDPKLYGGKYPFIQTGDVRGADHLITEYSQTYSEVGLAQSKLWPAGTLCITIAANIAETGILGFDACFPDSVIGVVVDPRITSNKFLEYLLQSLKAELKAQGKGAAQDNINMGTFESQTFRFPDPATQERVVATFDGLREEVARLEGIYEQKLHALDELKKSLLHHAFSGAL